MKILKYTISSLLILFIVLTSVFNTYSFNKTDNLEVKNDTTKRYYTSKKYYTTDGKLITKELLAERKANKKLKSKKNLTTFDKVVFNHFLSIDAHKFEKPKLDAFKKAFKGYYKLKKQGVLNKEILALIDFSESSTKRRLWIIDMKKKEVLLQTVVSHGINSGVEFAKVFSNVPQSRRSSLGFYKTAETYDGKNGLSLRLDGLEKGFNDKARERLIVMHGANYCDEADAKRQGYLGRSYGCPSIPHNLTPYIINMIKDGACLFIYSNKEQNYLNNSKFLN